MITLKEYAKRDRQKVLKDFHTKNNLLGTLSNKQGRICFYLLDHISINTNIYYFSVIKLANKFNCSKATVRKAINTLKSIKNFIVTNHFIRLKYYHPKHINKKGRDCHD